jgi:hypothetical protein
MGIFFIVVGAIGLAIIFPPILFVYAIFLGCILISD